MDKSFFLNLQHPMQKRYEALRANYVDGLSDLETAQEFGYTLYSFKSLKRDAKNLGPDDFFKGLKRGPKGSHAKTINTKSRIIQLRKKNYSVIEIQEKLKQEDIIISFNIIQSILKKEGFSRLFRRTNQERLETLQQGKLYAERSDVSRFGEKTVISTPLGGVFLFLPHFLQLRLYELLTGIGFYGTKKIPAISYLMSYLVLKLLGKERLCHINDFSFDYGLGAFVGLNVLPKSSAISCYSYRHSPELVKKMLKGFAKILQLNGYLKGQTINLDFHAIPHYGDESSLEDNWIPTRGKRMKSVLSFFAQDLDTTFLCYSNGIIENHKRNNEVLEFVKFYEGSTGLKPQRLVFDSKLTTYSNLWQLNQKDILFITLRRRGSNFLGKVGQITDWKQVRLDNIKRKYRNLKVSESIVSIKDYEENLRQIIIKGIGRELPIVLITNDFQSSAKKLITYYSYRWRIENNIQENVDFFNLNALSSPVVVKVDFDIAMTIIANTLYKLFAQETKWLKKAKPKTISRNFINANTKITIDKDTLKVKFAKKMYNPLLMDWLNSLDDIKIPWWNYRKLLFEFE